MMVTIASSPSDTTLYHHSLLLPLGVSSGVGHERFDYHSITTDVATANIPSKAEVPN